MSEIRNMMTPAEFQKDLEYRQKMRAEYETEVTSEISRLTRRAVELEDRCGELRTMNEQLRNILEVYLQADNRARQLMDGLH